MTITKEQKSYLEHSNRLCKGAINIIERSTGSILVERIYGLKGHKKEVFPVLVTKKGNWRSLNSYIM